MGLNKKAEFTEQSQELANYYKALSHPARLEILKYLAETKSCICGEIVDVLPLSQSTVSQHLKELQKVGLITGTIDGVKSCYCINWKAFEHIFKNNIGFHNQLLKQKINTNCC